ncbi:MAG: ferritin family protein [Syntrophobacterales bacterium]|nr:MAG: ferritin family protein [Syntrophobacterales bacterium]
MRVYSTMGGCLLGVNLEGKERNMRLDTFEDIVREAIRKEADAAMFYQMASERAKPGMDKMFIELAEEEQGHKKMLEELDMAKLRSYEFGKVPDLEISEYLEDLPYSRDMDYPAILRYAMKSEEKSRNFYLRSAKMCENPDLKKLFQMLAEEEAKHKLRFEKMYEDDVLESTKY